MKLNYTSSKEDVFSIYVVLGKARVAKFIHIFCTKPSNLLMLNLKQLCPKNFPGPGLSNMVPSVNYVANHYIPVTSAIIRRHTTINTVKGYK